MVTEIQDAEIVPPVVHDAALLPAVGDKACVVAQVSYAGEPPMHVSFYGSPLHGGPVVMITGYGSQFVDADVNARCGKFGVEWVMRFFGQGA